MTQSSTHPKQFRVLKTQALYLHHAILRDTKQFRVRRPTNSCPMHLGHRCRVRRARRGHLLPASGVYVTSCSATSSCSSCGTQTYCSWAAEGVAGARRALAPRGTGAPVHQWGDTRGTTAPRAGLAACRGATVPVGRARGVAGARAVAKEVRADVARVLARADEGIRRTGDATPGAVLGHVAGVDRWAAHGAARQEAVGRAERRGTVAPFGHVTGARRWATHRPEGPNLVGGARS